jgi:peptide-methionine (R)-S-oxide reductase
MADPLRDGERKLPDNCRSLVFVIVSEMQTPISRSKALAAVAAAGAAALFLGRRAPAPAATSAHYEVAYTDAQWRSRLSADAYEVLRHAGTEAPFSSPLDHLFKPGIYACAGCNLALFDAKTKFDSGTGWPSFYQPLPHAVLTSTDGSLGMDRTEVHCSRCGGHLGHVFDDGPQPTGLRYCMNGVALAFHPSSTKA